MTMFIQTKQLLCVQSKLIFRGRARCSPYFCSFPTPILVAPAEVCEKIQLHVPCEQEPFPVASLKSSNFYLYQIKMLMTF